MRKETEGSKIKCNICENFKEIDEFYPSSLEKKDYQCKVCKEKRRTEYSREFRNLIKLYYYRHKNNKKGYYVKYSCEELYNWAKNNKHFINLYNQWVISDYKDDLKPTLIRIRCDRSFTLDNLRILEKSKTDNFIVDSRERLVKQYDLEGNYIATYPNASVAARILGFRTYSGINAVCKGDRKIAYGFQWSYGPVACKIIKNTI